MGFETRYVYHIFPLTLSTLLPPPPPPPSPLPPPPSHLTATLRLSAAINGQAQLVLGDLLFAPEGSVIKAECFGSGILQWQNSSGSRISSNSQSMFYQEADPSRSVQTLNIRNFTRDTIDTYTCMTDLTTDGQTPVQLSLFITSCKLK